MLVLLFSFELEVLVILFASEKEDEKNQMHCIRK